MFGGLSLTHTAVSYLDPHGQWLSLHRIEHERYDPGGSELKVYREFVSTDSGTNITYNSYVAA